MHVDEHEGTLGQIVRPLASVGVYVPAGTAPLPSSLLMAAVIARVAGVETVIACAPTDRSTGRIPDVILAAAEIAASMACTPWVALRRLPPWHLARKPYRQWIKSSGRAVCS